MSDSEVIKCMIVNFVHPASILRRPIEEDDEDDEDDGDNNKRYV
jgi:hypothetical protein